MMSMHVLLLLLAYLKVAHFSNFITLRAVNWTIAKNECNIFVPEFLNPAELNFDVPITNKTTNTTLAWIGRYISYSEWIEFEGCSNTSANFIEMTFDISMYNDNRIWRCHNLCSSKYFGLTENECTCFTKSTRYQDIASLCSLNFREESNGGLYGFGGCICKYTKSDVMFAESNEGNCLSILYFKARSLVDNTRCDSANNMLGITGNGNGSFKLVPGSGSWIDNVKKCQSQKCILPHRIDFDNNDPFKNIIYWLNLFRIQLYQDHKQLTMNSPRRCMALRITGNRGAGTEIRNCSEKLPVVCADLHTLLSENEDDFTQIILICIVASMCVLVCFISILIGVLWYKKHIEQTSSVSHTEEVNVPDENHEYHEIELETTDSSSKEIYHRLHGTNNDENSGISTVYDHVQNPDYDHMPKRGESRLTDDSVFTEYDHAVVLKN